MIEANSQLFHLLDDYCSRRGDPVRYKDRIRYVYSNNEDKHDLQNTQIARVIKFGRHRALSLLTTGEGENLVATIGFEFDLDNPELEFTETSSGMKVALISEINPHPTASTANVRNIVEADDKSNPTYSGHHIDDIETLFPPIQTWRARDLSDDDSVWQVFLMVCVSECRLGGSWIDDDLARDLTTLAQLNVPSLPYHALCQSIFDLDPRSLYMALYRCIEATYAYDSCRQLVANLSLKEDWQSVARALASTVSWHPQESNSLQASLRYAIDEDLKDLCASLRANEGNNLRASTSKAIYDLRNQIVHYRPWQETISIDDLDWNRICLYLARIVLSVFDQAYTRHT